MVEGCSTTTLLSSSEGVIFRSIIIASFVNSTIISKGASNLVTSAIISAGGSNDVIISSSVSNYIASFANSVALLFAFPSIIFISKKAKLSIEIQVRAGLLNNEYVESECDDVVKLIEW